jgi:hypothetical protein
VDPNGKHMQLDDFMPQWQFNEYHQTMVAAPPAVVYETARYMDLGRSPIIKSLLVMRELPKRLLHRNEDLPGWGGSLDELLETGPFIRLTDAPPHEYVFGLAGRFWVPSPELRQLTPEEFIAFDEQGQAKVATNLLVTELGPNTCRLSTETRIQCLGSKAKRRFQRYWTMIRPFSGLIRIEWLRLIKKEALSRATPMPE